MKKGLILLLTTGILWSCNSKQHSATKEPVNIVDTTQHQEKKNLEELALNNSAKWKADSSTNMNVNNLHTIIENFYKGHDTSLPGYQKAANELQKGIAKMVNECRMKGPDHDALHKWLEPLLKQVNQFRQSSTTADAAVMLETISQHVNRYYQYFE